MNMNYSVLMSVYSKDKPEWLTQAIESILNQTYKSNDIVIVADGRLTDELNNVLRYYSKKRTIRIYRLKKNHGLSYALNFGLNKTKNDLVGRMDADDISLPNRFELQLKQFKMFPDLIILGGQIDEFNTDTNEVRFKRIVPLDYREIKKFANTRNPFNHPTVMFKKKSIINLGYYSLDALRLEDYELWLRALSENLLCLNLGSVIVKYRYTADSFMRRRNIASLISHLRFRKRLFKRKQINFYGFIYGVVTQIILFVLPLRLSMFAFHRLVRK